ncbi:hypothetical protein KC343_g8864 [Hortaea werneckii]|uniref:Extracellular membrane protein CFEM domain-containing protein n=1 Tax=Hortaea werneckii TaxID=91943 RepID=A0A3M7GJF9_HORWE|nr:hypothetical protein KC352_g27304 [Hortaea werneckii]KAI7560842.1 hypothetical protein KC317_g9468 [Hortaea werneckii]KAI7605860.1 hypothetical protein KC346_g10821 [Hortaea werneckii]KAI7619066.1 hypothetical protein KC343_g8864 [Hortaea werneckii]KAI7676025.1 hypothetical protein KC319_g4468 [Hortaea werneckii]
MMRAMYTLGAALIALVCVLAPSVQAAAVKKSFDCTQYCWDTTATEFDCTNSNKALEGECMCLNSNYVVFSSCNRICMGADADTFLQEYQVCSPSSTVHTVVGPNSNHVNRDFHASLAEMGRAFAREIADVNMADENAGSPYANTVDFSVTVSRDQLHEGANKDVGILDPAVDGEAREDAREYTAGTSTVSASIPAVPESASGSGIFSGILPPPSFSTRVKPTTMEAPAPFTKRQIIGQIPWKHSTTTKPEPPRTHKPKDPHLTDLASATFNFCGVPGAACNWPAGTLVTLPDSTFLSLYAPTVTVTVTKEATAHVDERDIQDPDQLKHAFTGPIMTTLSTYPGRGPSLPGLAPPLTIATAAPDVDHDNAREYQQDYTVPVLTSLSPGTTLTVFSPPLSIATAVPDIYDTVQERQLFDGSSAFITPSFTGMHIPPSQSEGPNGPCVESNGWCGSVPVGH